MTLPSTSAGRALLGARAALGVSTLLAPRLAGKAFFLDPADNPQLPVIGRMWGIRNLMLAAGMYAATGENRAQWWRLQPAVDALDFLAITAEWRRGAVPGFAAVLMAGTAVGATALGALAAPGRGGAAGRLVRPQGLQYRAHRQGSRRLGCAGVEFESPQFVEVGGRRLAYEEVAPADPQGTVLLLCGIGAKRQGWYKQLPVLGARYRAIALDYRDVGDSDAAGGPYSIGEVADDTYALAQELGIERASLIGISMGGFISLELALAHPEFVERLILVVTSAGGASHVSTSPEVMQALMPRPDEQFESGEGARRVCSLVAGPGFAERNPEAIEEFVEIAQHNPMHVEAYLRQLMACRAHNVDGRLSEITAPTLVIHGDADPLVRIENGRHLAAGIPGARLIVYDDIGHIPEVECFEQFNDDLLEFLP